MRVHFSSDLTISEPPNLASLPQPLKRIPWPTSNCPLPVALGLRWNYMIHMCARARTHTHTRTQRVQQHCDLYKAHGSTSDRFLICVWVHVFIRSFTKCIPIASWASSHPIREHFSLQAPTVSGGTEAGACPRLVNFLKTSLNAVVEAELQQCSCSNLCGYFCGGDFSLWLPRLAALNPKEPVAKVALLQL